MLHKNQGRVFLFDSEMLSAGWTSAFVTRTRLENITRKYPVLLDHLYKLFRIAQTEAACNTTANFIQ